MNNKQSTHINSIHTIINIQEQAAEAANQFNLDSMNTDASPPTTTNNNDNGFFTPTATSSSTTAAVDPTPRPFHTEPANSNKGGNNNKNSSDYMSTLVSNNNQSSIKTEHKYIQYAGFRRDWTMVD